MNKYTIITLMVLSTILFISLHFLDIQYKWWYLIIIYIISNYNGKVMQQTFKGFNINNLIFLEKINEDQQFTCDVVSGFSGKIISFNGVFKNTLNIDPNQLRVILVKDTNHNDITKTLQNNEEYIKIYKYRSNDIKVIFTKILN